MKKAFARIYIPGDIDIKRGGGQTVLEMALAKATTTFIKDILKENLPMNVVDGEVKVMAEVYGYAPVSDEEEKVVRKDGPEAWGLYP